MDILQEDSFQAIFGLGPPASAVSFAQKDADEIEREAKTYTEQGNTITPEVKEIIDRYTGSLTHAKTATPFEQILGLTSMSVCFHKPSGSGGYHIWHDDAVQTEPNKFVQIPVAGDSYWSAEMTGVTLGRAEMGKIVAKNSPFARPHSLGCKDHYCSAVLDTGSTLISAPSAVVSHL